MNILVTALSLYKDSKAEEYVLTKEGRAYRVTGQQTNEPVPKALQLYLKAKGQQLDKMILLCTPAALKPDNNGTSAADKFRDAMATAGITPDIHILNLDEMADSRTIYNASLELLEMCRPLPEPELYIDSTGGFRDAMMFLISMMQLLKGENFRIADVFYTVYDRNMPAPYPIVSRMDAYQVYDLISGYEALNTYGDPRKLKEFFATRPISDQAKSILNTLQSVYQEMQLCRVAQSNSALLRLSGLLEQYTRGDSAFDRVVELSQAKYGGIRDGFTYPDYIKWYFNHGYIPQTLAFFYETLPDILISNRILYPSASLTAALQKTQNSQVASRNERYSFINTYFKETYHSFKVKATNAKEEVLSLAYAGNIPVEELHLSDAGKKLHTGMYYVMLGKLDRRQLEKPEAAALIRALQSEKTPELRSAEDLWMHADLQSIYTKIAANQKLLCTLYDIDPEEKELTDRAHAQLIVDSADNKDIFLGENVDPQTLVNLLEKYFYLKKQRNSILHVGQDSASHKTLLKNIAEAIALMDEVI